MNIAMTGVKRDMVAADPGGSIDLEFLKVAWSVGNGGLEVDVRVGFKGLSWSQKVFLSVFHPSVKVSSPHVAGTYVSVTLSFDDDDGRLSIEGEAHWWAFGHHHKSVKGSVPVVPPFIFGLIGVGARFPKVLEYAPQIIRAGLNYRKLLAFKGAFYDACHLGVSPSALTGFIGINGGDLFAGVVRSVPSDDAARHQLASLPPPALVTALQAVVNDPRIQAIYPGIQHHFRSDEGEGVAPAAVSAPARAPGTNVVALILEILGGLVVLAGIGATALGALAAIIGLIIAGLAATAAVTATWILIAIGILFCVGIVALMAIAALLVVAGLIIGLVVAFDSDSSPEETRALPQVA